MLVLHCTYQTQIKLYYTYIHKSIPYLVISILYLKIRNVSTLATQSRFRHLD